MDTTPAVRRSARRLLVPPTGTSSASTLSPHPRLGRPLSSTPKPTPGRPRSTPDNRQKCKTPVLKSALKKNVRFAEATPTHNIWDKENDQPSEDELVAATISSKKSRTIATPTPKKGAKEARRTLEFRSPSRLEFRSPGRAVPPPSTSTLKRKLASEETGTRRKMPRVEAGNPLATPAKRPMQPLKQNTPAIRAPPMLQQANPIPPATPLRAAPSRNVAATPKTDIFTSSDSFVTALSKGWQFDQHIATRPNVLGHVNGLATPARRPALAFSTSLSTGNTEVKQRTAPMSCPPKRPVVGTGATVGKKLEFESAKLSALATPARRPEFGTASGFAQHTQSSLARSTPPRASPLKEAPKRPPGLSPLRSAMTMADIAEQSSPASKGTVGGYGKIEPRTPLSTRPKRRAHAAAVSPQRISRVDEGEEPVLSATLSNMKLSERASTFSAPHEGFTTPTNRKLFFDGHQKSSSKAGKSDFDIYVDEEEAKKEEGSMSTKEVFGNSPPKTLGTRRESGLFLASPDRSVSIGPFTSRISTKSSPLKREYEKDLRRASGAASLAGSPAGNFFLNTMNESPRVVYRRTMIVPLKGLEDIEDSDDELDEELELTDIAEEVVEEDAPGPLSDVAVFLDVRTSDGADASASFAEDLQKLGAKVVRRWRLNTFSRGDVVNVGGVNLVVFKDGCSGTISKAKTAKVPCVGVAWVKECLKMEVKAAYDEFLVDNNTMLGLKKQRTNPMVPRPNKHATPRKEAPRGSVATPRTPKMAATPQRRNRM